MNGSDWRGDFLVTPVFGRPAVFELERSEWIDRLLNFLTTMLFLDWAFKSVVLRSTLSLWVVFVNVLRVVARDFDI